MADIKNIQASLRVKLASAATSFPSSVREIEQTGEEVQVGIEIMTGDPAILEQIALI